MKEKLLKISNLLAILFIIVGLFFEQNLTNELESELQISTSGLFYFNSALSILFLSLVEYNIYKGKLLIYKEKNNLFSVLGLIFSNNKISLIICIINIFIISSLQRISKDDYPDKLDIPKINIKNNKNDIFKSIFIIILYFSQFLLSYLPINNFNILMFVQITFDLIMLFTIIILFNKTLINDLKIFIKNFNAYSGYLFSKIGLLYLILFVTRFISIAITKNESSVNQLAVESLPLWYMIPAATIWAPIVEETIFRKSLGSLIKNDKLFIIVSGFIFGLLHATSEASIINMIGAAIPYISIGCMFAYIYRKTNNIFSSIFCHFFINTVSTILLCLL